MLCSLQTRRDYERKKVIIYELDSTIAKQTASIMVEISYITYTIDKNGFVISGNRDIPVTERFEVEFRKEFEREIPFDVKFSNNSCHG